MTLTVLSFNMRKNPHNFGECGNIVMGTVVVLMSCVMSLVGYKLSPIEVRYLTAATSTLKEHWS